MSIIQNPWAWEPPCQSQDEYDKELWIKNKIQEICSDISERGDKFHRDIYDMIWLYLEDNFYTYFEGPEDE
jgi:hypothetical protein